MADPPFKPFPMEELDDGSVPTGAVAVTFTLIGLGAIALLLGALL